MAPGKSAEFSVKSSHPQFPVIKVPILQPARPAPTARASPSAKRRRSSIPGRMAAAEVIFRTASGSVSTFSNSRMAESWSFFSSR